MTIGIINISKELIFVKSGLFLFLGRFAHTYSCAMAHALAELDDDKRHVVRVRSVPPCCHTIENRLLHLL
jgi:hypothetical protein